MYGRDISGAGLTNVQIGRGTSYMAEATKVIDEPGQCKRVGCRAWHGCTLSVILPALQPKKAVRVQWRAQWYRGTVVKLGPQPNLLKVS